MDSGINDTRPIEGRCTDRSEGAAASEADAHFTFLSSPSCEEFALFFRAVLTVSNRQQEGENM